VKLGYHDVQICYDLHSYMGLYVFVSKREVENAHILTTKVLCLKEFFPTIFTSLATK
jgi:hypothetical protein